MNCRPVVENSWGAVEKQLCTSRTTSMQNYLPQHCRETSTISQLSLNSGVTNVDCNGEMANVRDNGATNNNDINTTLQQKFKFLEGKNEIEW